MNSHVYVFRHGTNPRHAQPGSVLAQWASILPMLRELARNGNRSALIVLARYQQGKR